MNNIILERQGKKEDITLPSNFKQLIKLTKQKFSIEVFNINNYLKNLK